MPPKAKRKQFKSKVDKITHKQDTSDLELESSPYRPAAKRRKVNSTRSTRRKTPSSEFDQPRVNGSENEDEDTSLIDIVDSVVSVLSVSKDPVIAVRQYANAKQEQEDDSRKVNAFAKIAGRDWTYFVRDTSINIGRPPDDRQSVNGASSPVQDLQDHFPVHLDLGPNKIVSRHHAEIKYEGDGEREGWFIRVNGRNGVRVNNTLLKRGARQQIVSGTILDIAGTQMMFVLPEGRVQIDPYFLDHAKNTATGEEMASEAQPRPEPNQWFNSASAYPSLAPAPPDFKRASTPPIQMDGRNQRGVFDSKSAMSPMYGRGMMMESTQEIDYSSDSAKDLKPPFSYATMIAQAIFASEEEKLTLSHIYQYIADKYAFYRFSNSGWQNSIRHNLSLNKAFQKVPRRTDEPGKGMKWQIAAESRQEYYKKQARRNGGSAPSSPAATGKVDVNPNFRGPNGQNLGYDTSFSHTFSVNDRNPPGAGSFGPAPSAYGPPNAFGQPPSFPPPMHSDPNVTPQRRSRADTLPDPSSFDSPHSNNTPNASYPAHQTYHLPSALPHHHGSPTGPRNPTLSSSYLDTPFHPSHTSLITPAPLRQNPRLAPPSTLVAPSKFMPESSPVGGPGLFWKGIMGVTPGQTVPDLSPIKSDPDLRTNGINRDVMSSSPPPMEPIGSPSKPARGSQVGMSSQLKKGNSIDQDGDTMMGGGRSRSTTANAYEPGRAGAQSNTVAFQVNANANGRDVLPPQQADVEEDEAGDEGGFDLAKGFAPIGAGLRRSVSAAGR